MDKPLAARRLADRRRERDKYGCLTRDVPVSEWTWRETQQRALRLAPADARIRDQPEPGEGPPQ
jgi:hypothetical protein